MIMDREQVRIWKRWPWPT